MTNRFEYVYLDELGVNAIKDNVTGKHTPLSEKIAGRLNNLHDEKEHYRKQLEAIRNVIGDLDRGYDSYDCMEMFNALGDILNILKEDEDTL